MGKNPGVIKAVLELHKQGFTYISIARTLNLHIEEVVNIINGYSK
jgi:hypothetical protein